MRLVGDDQQLAAVAAGGVFADLAQLGHAHGTTATLTELHRFTDPAEGAATLAIRDGDPAALDHYLDHDWVHAGDAGTATEAAHAAWVADQQAGLSSLLLARRPWLMGPAPAPATPSSPAATNAPCVPVTGHGRRMATDGISLRFTLTGPSRPNATTAEPETSQDR